MKPLDRFLQRWRIRTARPHLPKGARVLDIGCADGALFQHLATWLREGVGIDPGAESNESRPAFRLIRGSFPRDLSDAQPFDAITLLAVLEHIPMTEQPGLALACFESLKPGGRLILTVPSPHVDMILEMLRRLHLIDGQSLEQHYGFRPEETPPLFTRTGFRLVLRHSFQLGLNNLFVFEKPCALTTSRGAG